LPRRPWAHILIVPGRFSRIVTSISTAVTAAASVPFSFTSAYVLCFTRVMHSTCGTCIRVKSAISGGSQSNAIPMPSARGDGRPDVLEACRLECWCSPVVAVRFAEECD